MTSQKNKIGFIGCGNMAEAIIGALIRSDLFKPESIHGSDANTNRLGFIAEKYGIQTAADNVRVFDACDIIILAVKPQFMNDVLAEITSAASYPDTAGKLVISIAAGISLQKFENALYQPIPDENRKTIPIIRVMPNTPSLVLSGMSGMSPNRYAGRDEIALTRKILESMGRVIQVEEKFLDAVTAVSGSGPAYVFFFIESMIQAGVELKLSEEESRLLTIETFKGALTLLEKSGESPEELRKKVTSPGGTTEAALNVMHEKALKEIIKSAIRAAAHRSEELSS